MSKIQTPDWILKDKEKPTKEQKAKPLVTSSKFGQSKESKKTYKIRVCPKCGSSNVAVVLGYEEGKGKGEWECHKCKWVGKDVKEEELSEEKFLQLMEEQHDN